MTVRPIDHLVLPVSGLSNARARLSALGFTVAPDGIHPFGTANACVFFSDGTYLEPLAIANRRQANLTAKRGNVFTSRDLAFRKIRNRQGLSAVVVGTADAPADHGRFVEREISAGEMLEFSRAMVLPDGTSGTGSFRLAFAGHENAPDFFLFACQRINPLPADRAELERHSNAVTGIAEVILSAPQPTDFVSLLEDVFETTAEVEDGHVKIRTANGLVRVLPDEVLEAELSIRPGSNTPGLQARAAIFTTTDLAVTEITLAANDVTFVRRDGRVTVAPADGQGVLFGFRE